MAVASHVTVDEILAAVEHLVLPPLPGVDVQPVLAVLGHLIATRGIVSLTRPNFP
jgi:hypothetical protein